MALGNGTEKTTSFTGRHWFILTYEEISQSKNSSNQWVSTFQWRVDLQSTDQYGAIDSSGSKPWKVKLNGTQVASGSSSIGMEALETITLASGTTSVTRLAPARNESFTFEFSQTWNITFNGERISIDGFAVDVKMGAIVDEARITQTNTLYDTGDIKFTYYSGSGLSNLYFVLSRDVNGNYPLTGQVIMPIDSGKTLTYEATMTDDLRNLIRSTLLHDKPSATIYYILYSVFPDGSTVQNSGYSAVRLSDSSLTLTADVYDVNEKTLAITGDRNTFIKYASIAEYAYEVVSSPYGADIVTHYVQNGNFKAEGYTGRIEGVENGTFYFYAKDSRGNVDDETITRTIIDYVKPTCNSMATTELSGELGTGATVELRISGNFFNGSFGSKQNRLQIMVKHTQNNGSMGDWVDLSPLAYETEGNTYTFHTTITGLSYDQTYTFHCKCIDLLYEIESEPFTLKVLPVFDWSEDDFNFNVPVRMFKNTVVRYNMDAHNTVLSGGEEGKIYLRPGGSEETDGEVIIHSNGNVDVSGNLDATGISVNGIPFSPNVDYIIETGSEAMGSNGTWYWEKWYSGKAVCWGTRNFGIAAINTDHCGYYNQTPLAYRSASYTQDFPSGLFKAKPDSIQMCLTGLNSTNIAVNLQPYDTLPSSSSVGTFVFTCPIKGLSMQRSDVSFYAIGRWK